jgi:hypothetical protein
MLVALLKIGLRFPWCTRTKCCGQRGQAKDGPLRVEHARHINFISDFMKANKQATRGEAVAAWNALKKLDTPKTYQAWLKTQKA